MIETTRFSFSEMMSLLGMIQCIYILVYILFRVGHISRVVLPLFYFTVMAGAFLMDFARVSVGAITPYYDVVHWFLWFYGPPISVLLIIQMARITKLPPPADWIVLLFIPLAFLGAVFMARGVDNCTIFITCPSREDWLSVFGLVAGAMSLLVIWANRNVFDTMRQQKAGQERYWLVLSLVIVNVFFLIAVIFQLSGQITSGELALIRAVLGLSFIYLVTTSLFRIYPQALALATKKVVGDVLTATELECVKKIEDLLLFDKIYHEASYSRADLAREVGVSEAVVSKVINAYFHKSFPQLLNEYRVSDAKSLLLETDASIKVIAEEVGFNSLPSFNRAFKDVVGQSAGQYRKNMIK